MVSQTLTSQVKALFSDGEGPLVFKDLASDLMGRITFKLRDKEIKGADFFELLSLYDDYLAEVRTEGYQAGDTLALVVPHFLHHGLTDEDVVNEAKDVKVCLGVKEYIDGLKRDGVEVRIISTAYSQMWNLIGDYLGIPKEHIACTKLDLKSLREKYQTPQLDGLVEKMEQDILPMLPLVPEMKDLINEGKSVVHVFQAPRYRDIRNRLDRFYWRELREQGYETLRGVEVVGGRRKVEAAKRFAAELNVPLSAIAYVGDSITDDAMHERLKAEGGLPIAINGNVYALRNAKVAVATKDMRALRPVVDRWWKGGFEGVKNFVNEAQSARLRGGKEGMRIPPEEGPYYHLLETAEDFEKALAVHKVFRKLVRGSAAKLG